jgi:peptidoglycan/LPS O-acetylase OafA/YrhL
MSSERPADTDLPLHHDLGHRPALDGVRGVAILLVLAHNLDIISGHQSLIGHLMDLAVNEGWIGVQLFFVLSGFLITGILLDARAAPNYYSAFFARRFLRIFPLYYATLFVAFVVLPRLTSQPPDGHHQIWLWLYLSNWHGLIPGYPPEFPHFWSLGVEEQFYLVWPFVVRRLSPRRLLRLCAGLMVFAFAVRVVMRHLGSGPEPVYQWTVCRVDALAAGAAVAVMLRLPEARRAIERNVRGIGLGAWGLLVVGLFATHAFPRTIERGQTFGYTILALVFAALVMFAARGDRSSQGAGAWGAWLGRWLRAVPLRVMGKYSYGMYVFHMPIHFFVRDHVTRWAMHRFGEIGVGVDFAYLIGGVVVTFVAAFLSYHLLEKHFLACKRWFVPSLPPSSSAAARPISP